MTGDERRRRRKEQEGAKKNDGIQRDGDHHMRSRDNSGASAFRKSIRISQPEIQSRAEVILSLSTELLDGPKLLILWVRGKMAKKKKKDEKVRDFISHHS